MRPFNSAQLSCMITAIEQCRQSFNKSSTADSIAGHAEDQNHDKLQYLSTPKEFKSFDSSKQLQYDGNMLTPDERSSLY